MKGITPLQMTIIILLSTWLLTGCWNYREVEKLTVVAGVAIDKGKNHKYQITVETIEISGGQEAKQVSKLISMEGDTIFDAARNGISIAGKKLYWSHSKIVIISEEISREGVLGVVDWFNRDSETRADVMLLVSKEKKAKDIFSGSGETNEIKSFELVQTLKNENAISKAPVVELWKFTNELEARGIVATLPTVSLIKNGDRTSPQIQGTAIFSKDKLLGFINGDETKNMLFVLDEVKGGLLNISGTRKKNSAPVSLEIFKSKTTKKPIIRKGNIEFNINIDTMVGLDEIGINVNILQEKSLKELKQQTEEAIKSRVEKSIKHIQSSYGVDIFGFGDVLREEKPQIWKQISGQWEKRMFKKIKVNVAAKVNIKGSGMLSKPIQIGD